MTLPKYRNEILKRISDREEDKLLIDADKLKGAIKSAGFSMAGFAERLKITRTSLPRKIKEGQFSADDIYDSIEALGLREDPKKIIEIFFAKKVS